MAIIGHQSQTSVSLSTGLPIKISMEDFMRDSGEKVGSVKIWECMERAVRKIALVISMMGGGAMGFIVG